MTFFDKIKQGIWRFVYKFFSTGQKALLKWGVVQHDNRRQRYHIGWLSPGKTLEELKEHLHEKWNFGNHFIAWTERDQVLKWIRTHTIRIQRFLLRKKNNFFAKFSIPALPSPIVYPLHYLACRTSHSD